MFKRRPRMWRRSPLATAVGLWAAWRLFGPEPSPTPRGLQSRPEGPEARTVVAGRNEFGVRESGPEGAPIVVLLHGWLYDSHATWHRVIPVLSERYRVVAIDLRNHGKSDRVRSRFEVADMADDVARVLDVLGLGPVPVVGYSLGGMVAQELALRSPARVSALFLGATAAHPVRLARWVTVPLFVALRALSRFDRFLLPRLAHLYLMRTGVVPDEHGAWLWRVILDRDVDLYWKTGFAILRFDARDRINAIGVPTTCLVTTDDQLVSVGAQRETVERIPGAVAVDLVGAKHEAVFTHSDEVAKAIIDHLDRLG